MLYNEELRCYAVINVDLVDKSALSIGRQVNAFQCSSTHYRLGAAIGFRELALKMQCVLPAFSTRI